MSERSLTKRIRQNHAIEHATLTILAQKQPNLRLVARSDLQGFIVYGEVALSDLWSTAEEALQRLRDGESGLAVHAYCGTNLVTAGTLSALAALLAASGRRRTLWERVPSAILGATGALILAGPVGRWLQAHVTTSADVNGAAVSLVQKLGDTLIARHRVAIT